MIAEVDYCLLDEDCVAESKRTLTGWLYTVFICAAIATLAANIITYSNSISPVATILLISASGTPVSTSTLGARRINAWRKHAFSSPLLKPVMFQVGKERPTRKSMYSGIRQDIFQLWTFCADTRMVPALRAQRNHHAILMSSSGLDTGEILESTVVQSFCQYLREQLGPVTVSQLSKAVAGTTLEELKRVGLSPSKKFFEKHTDLFKYTAVGSTAYVQLRTTSLAKPTSTSDSISESTVVQHLCQYLEKQLGRMSIPDVADFFPGMTLGELKQAGHSLNKKFFEKHANVFEYTVVGSEAYVQLKSNRIVRPTPISENTVVQHLCQYLEKQFGPVAVTDLNKAFPGTTLGELQLVGLRPGKKFFAKHSELFEITIMGTGFHVQLRNRTTAKPTSVSESTVVQQDAPVVVGPARGTTVELGDQSNASERRPMYDLLLVDTEEALTLAAEQLAFKSPELQATVAIDVEGVPDDIYLVQVAISDSRVYVFDCVKLDTHHVFRLLRPLLESEDCVKILHDLRSDAYAFAVHGRVDTMRGLLDTQLVAEHIWGDVFVGLSEYLHRLGLETHPTKFQMKARMERDKSSGEPPIWSKRPLNRTALEYAALDALLLLDAMPRMIERLQKGDLEMLMLASSERAMGAVKNKGARSMTFDTVSDYALASAELLKFARPADAFELAALIPDKEEADVIDLLPVDLRSKLQHPVQTQQMQTSLQTRFDNEGHVPLQQVATPSETFNNVSLVDIVLDVGRRPIYWISSERCFLSDNEERVVTYEDLACVMSRIGPFGSDNRASLDHQLHRISAVKTNDHNVSGLTIRVGRSVRGAADMMIDVLLGSDKSVLVLGEPGSRKTTIIREVARLLAQRQNVFVIDTSNEIAGNGVIPHPSIGNARRMMVPSLSAQHRVMVECVQNHQPHVMVIDEIGRSEEVMAARTVKHRGVRMIASAHGDLRSLLKNHELNKLIGGVGSIFLGDGLAIQDAKRYGGDPILSKIKLARQSEPTFDVIIEVRRDVPNTWRVSTDVARSVDSILLGRKYLVQERTRDPVTGAVFLNLTRA